MTILSLDEYRALSESYPMLCGLYRLTHLPEPGRWEPVPDTTSALCFALASACKETP